MKGNRITLLFLLGMMMASCSEGDDIVQETAPQRYNILFSVGSSASMRMANDVVQTEGQNFRRLNSLLAIPFRTNGAEITANDVPLLSSVSEANVEIHKVSDGDSRYFIASCSMMTGTNRLLVYASAAPVAGKNKNGVLVPTLAERIYPKDISFSLQSIRDTKDAHDDAQALANYLTAIANTEGWSTTPDLQLKGLYLDFIHADTEGTGLMAGSAANVRAYATALKTQLTEISGDLRDAIIANIENTTTIEDNIYPASIGLPDGVAALRWNDGAFRVRTETTTLDNINSIIRYTYPAELWYLVDSPIQTSLNEVSKDDYAEKTWDQILSTCYTNGNSVMPSTLAVAVEQPLQYGVGRLEMTLTEIASTLKDAKGQDFHGSKEEQTLKGVIIGGQHTVGFDFKPREPQSDVDARFIYDSEVGTAGTDGKWTVNTLVLQSYDNEKVPVILEFQNNSDYKFVGKDGIIYPGTKFYLIAQLDPAGKGEGDCAGRVFTQDYTTKVTMKVESLENAYSCMPDLMSPRLEIGVRVTTSWIQSTTTTVKL